MKICKSVLQGIVRIVSALGKCFAAMKKSRRNRTESKERNNMLKIFLLIALLAGVIGAVITVINRPQGTGGDKKPSGGGKTPAGGDETPKPAAPEMPSFQKLLAQSCRLEQRITSVVGGDTGLARLLGAIETSPLEKDEDNIYVITYRSKQEKLAEYMEEYRELEAKAAHLPADECARVLFSPKNYKLYQTLLEQKI